MKNSMYLMLLASSLLMATVFVSCQSNADKVENATEDVVDAQQDLRDAKQEAAADAQRAASEDEWRMWRTEHEVIVKNNEARLKELRAKMKKSNTAADKAYLERLDAMDQRNKDLYIRIDTYEANKSDWESFKREFKHDMDAIGDGFRQLTVNNK